MSEQESLRELPVTEAPPQPHPAVKDAAPLMGIEMVPVYVNRFDVRAGSVMTRVAFGEGILDGVMPCRGVFLCQTNDLINMAANFLDTIQKRAMAQQAALAEQEAQTKANGAAPEQPPSP